MEGNLARKKCWISSTEQVFIHFSSQDPWLNFTLDAAWQHHPSFTTVNIDLITYKHILTNSLMIAKPDPVCNTGRTPKKCKKRASVGMRAQSDNGFKEFWCNYSCSGSYVNSTLSRSSATNNLLFSPLRRFMVLLDITTRNRSNSRVSLLLYGLGTGPRAFGNVNLPLETGIRLLCMLRRGFSKAKGHIFKNQWKLPMKSWPIATLEHQRTSIQILAIDTLEAFRWRLGWWSTEF